MNHGQNLRDLLEPLGVYRWEGSFQWGELQSEGAALDGVADALASLQQEMNLTTAQGEGLNRVLELLGRERGQEDPETLRETLAALLRIGNGAFTLAAMNDAEPSENAPHILGLHVVEQIAIAHGGKAEFAQNIPQGAKAVISLPME